MLYEVAVISHNRPQNVLKILEIIGQQSRPVTFFVNTGEKEKYLQAGAYRVIECGTDIVAARNEAIKQAEIAGVFSIQVSDDLRSLKRIALNKEIGPDYGARIITPVTFTEVAEDLVNKMETHKANYGGVAVTTNRLNYNGEDISLDKLVVCDLICVRPGEYQFDPVTALKEDYDLCLQLLTKGLPVVRLNNYLCDFPHRDNEGGANDYRNSVTEDKATKALLAKWPGLIKNHPTREGQIALNYPEIRSYNKNKLF